MAILFLSGTHVDYSLENVWNAEARPLRQFDPDPLAVALHVQDLLNGKDHCVVSFSAKNLKWQFRLVQKVFGLAFVQHLCVVNS